MIVRIEFLPTAIVYFIPFVFFLIMSFKTDREVKMLAITFTAIFGLAAFLFGLLVLGL